VATRRRPIVAIDGPAGAGKSTISRKLADSLGFVLVDTGAMYRAVALAAQRAGVTWSDAARLGEIVAAMLARSDLSFVAASGRGALVLLAGEDVSAAIRTPDIGLGASQVSAHAEVRDALLELQRQAGRDGGVVLEGRDIGTVVFPDAEVKFFLTARPDVRARRRYQELVAKGQNVTFETTLADVLTRDQNDTNRAHAPLRQADDAILVDNSDTSIDEVVAFMTGRVRANEGG
jgi:cytidylate kinase